MFKNFHITAESENDDDDDDETSSNNNFNVAFKGIGSSGNQLTTGNNSNSYKCDSIDLVTTSKLNTDECMMSTNRNLIKKHNQSNKLNSCKTLQRKLELKVERAKRNYGHRNDIIVSILTSDIICQF